jgi:hypothetical protein
MANLEVNADNLAGQAGGFSEIAGTADSINDYLVKGSAGISFPDQDDISAEFAQVWAKLTGGVSELLTSFGTGMRGISSNIITTATIYKNTNVANAENVPKIDS